jgi:hypothetical protein
MGAGRRNRWILIALLLLLAVAPADEEGEEGREAPEKWEDNLISLEPVRLKAGEREQGIELTIERWGEASGRQKFTVAVERRPAFVEEARWEPGDEVVFEEKDERKTVVLHLELGSSGGGEGEDELVFVVRASDEALSPRERRYVLSFGFGRGEPAGTAFVIKEDAPEEIEPEDLLEHVDRDAAPLYCCDRVAVFFTPPVDPAAAKVVFYWTVVAPEEEEEEDEKEDDDEGSGKKKEEKKKQETTRWSQGGYWNPGDWFHNDSVARFEEEDAPAAFGVELSGSGKGKALRPGRYSVKTAFEGKSEDSLLGVEGGKIGEYEEVGSFELAPLPDLVFASFSSDPGGRKDLADSPEVHEGWAEFAGVSAAGRKVKFTGRADYRGMRATTAGPKPALEMTRFEQWFEIEFPEVLRMGEWELGELQCKFGPGLGVNSSGFVATLQFVAAVTKLYAVAEGRPDPELVQGEELPLGVASIVPSEGRNENLWGPSAFKLPHSRVEEGGPYPWTVFGTSVGPTGRPKRSLGAHLHDDDTVFVIPVRFSFLTGMEDPPSYDQYGYAIYRPKRQG